MVVSPLILAPKGIWNEVWFGYDGWIVPPGVKQEDRQNLLYKEAYDKYGPVARANTAGIKNYAQVPLRGQMWDYDTDGHITMVSGGQRVDGSSEDKEVVSNLWVQH